MAHDARGPIYPRSLTTSRPFAPQLSKLGQQIIFGDSGMSTKDHHVNPRDDAKVSVSSHIGEPHPSRDSSRVQGPSREIPSRQRLYSDSHAKSEILIIPSNSPRGSAVPRGLTPILDRIDFEGRKIYVPTTADSSASVAPAHQQAYVTPVPEYSSPSLPPSQYPRKPSRRTRPLASNVPSPTSSSSASTFPSYTSSFSAHIQPHRQPPIQPNASATVPMLGVGPEYMREGHNSVQNNSVASAGVGTGGRVARAGRRSNMTTQQNTRQASHAHHTQHYAHTHKPLSSSLASQSTISNTPFTKAPNTPLAKAPWPFPLALIYAHRRRMSPLVSLPSTRFSRSREDRGGEGGARVAWLERWREAITHMPRSCIRARLANPWVTPVLSLHTAATAIQRWWRRLRRNYIASPEDLSRAHAHAETNAYAHEVAVDSSAETASTSSLVSSITSSSPSCSSSTSSALAAPSFPSSESLISSTPPFLAGGSSPSPTACPSLQRAHSSHPSFLRHTATGGLWERVREVVVGGCAVTNAVEEQGWWVRDYSGCSEAVKYLAKGLLIEHSRPREHVEVEQDKGLAPGQSKQGEGENEEICDDVGNSGDYDGVSSAGGRAGSADGSMPSPSASFKTRSPTTTSSSTPCASSSSCSSSAISHTHASPYASALESYDFLRSAAEMLSSRASEKHTDTHHTTSSSSLDPTSVADPYHGAALGTLDSGYMRVCTWLPALAVAWHDSVCIEAMHTLHGQLDAVRACMHAEARIEAQTQAQQQSTTTTDATMADPYGSQAHGGDAYGTHKDAQDALAAATAEIEDILVPVSGSAAVPLSLLASVWRRAGHVCPCVLAQWLQWCHREYIASQSSQPPPPPAQLHCWVDILLNNTTSTIHTTLSRPPHAIFPIVAPDGTVTDIVRPPTAVLRGVAAMVVRGIRASGAKEGVRRRVGLLLLGERVRDESAVGTSVGAGVCGGSDGVGSSDHGAGSAAGAVVDGGEFITQPSDDEDNDASGHSYGNGGNDGGENRRDGMTSEDKSGDGYNHLHTDTDLNTNSTSYMSDSRLALFHTHPLYTVAAISIQRQYRQYRMHRLDVDVKAYRDRRDKAARSIQRAWRAYTDKRVYRYMRDLVVGRTMGDAATVMKVINPSEAHLLDGASGLYARFRLGGASFPPVLYYKLFSARPVADIGAFAPRFYAHSGRKDAAGGGSGAGGAGGGVRTTSRTPHNTNTTSNINTSTNTASTPSSQGSGHWYVRVDNNPWRPVAWARLFDVVGGPEGAAQAYYGKGQYHIKSSDPRVQALAAHLARGQVRADIRTNTHTRPGLRGSRRGDNTSTNTTAASTGTGTSSVKPFHPQRLVRQVDLLRKRKLMKVKWLQQLYGIKPGNGASNADTVSSDNDGDRGDSAISPANHYDHMYAGDYDTRSDVAMMQMGPGDHPFALPTDSLDANTNTTSTSTSTSVDLHGTLGHRVLAHSRPEDALDGQFWSEVDAALVRDDMVEWAQALDYESYAATWALLGTTRPAAEPAPKR